MKYIRPMAFTLLLALAQSTYAQLEADPLPGDPKLVVFQYDENNSYRVYSKPRASTHIQLEKDEVLKVLTMGDTSGWLTAKKENNIFIKPRFQNTSTSGTMITNKRTYQFVFISTTDNGRWYQRVSFQDPANMMVESYENDILAINRETKVLNGDTYSQDKHQNNESPLTISPENLNFKYDIVGEADIRPSNVFDDGFMTYVQLKEGEDVPAVFRLVDKNIELVDYTIRGNNLIIPRVMEAGLLKLGKQEIRFYNLKKMKKGLFSGYRIEGDDK